jgi:hypothetical protein
MSASHVIDYRGHPACIAPLERHEFVGSDYDCSFCHRPRALHASHDQPAIPSNIDPASYPIRSVSFSIAMRGRLLTDRDISKYAAKGYYSAEFREARKTLWQNRAQKRKSNFVSRDGRLIYCP